MKKRMLGMFLALTLVLLAACSSTPATETKPEETNAPAAVPPMNTAAPSMSESSPEVTESVPEKEEDARLETALKLVGHPVQELYDAIGQPESVDYAPSCLGSGEDGELQYGAFTVYTYKEGNSETVQSVS